MVIGIDCRFWSQTGVGRYTRNLVKNLLKIDKINSYVLFVNSSERPKVEKLLGNANFTIVEADIPWHGVLEQIKFPQLIRKSAPDLMHFPYFSVPIMYSGKFVVTIHDLIINSHKTGKASTLPYPLYLAKRVGYNVVLASAISRADKIIVPSNSVADDIMGRYARSKGKLEVVYEGGLDNEDEIKNSRKKYLEERYILRVGNFYPHKNIEKLIDGFRDLLLDGSYDDIKLVLVGKKDYFYKCIESLIFEKNLSDSVIFIENPNDETLYSLYENAVATVIPSFSEGFSLTGVEAISCGSPLLASDIDVHREILGRAAIYCNPHDAHDIKLKLDYMINMNSQDRKDLIKEGERQAKKYSWEKMARQTLTVYENIGK